MRRLALAAALVALAAAAAAHALTRPDPAAQAVADGCGRADSAAIQNLAPEWAYVNDAGAPASGPPPPPQWLKGIVDAAGRERELAVHVSGGDIGTTHRSYDLNVDVLPDPPYAALMGGDPVARTGNFAPGGDEAGRMHVELESGAIPTFAWPEIGDRVEFLGSWVWDCGHWLPGGERTEIHPFRALWLERSPRTHVSPRSPSRESEGDVFVTTNETGAGKIADCAHRTKALGEPLKACFASAPEWQDVSGSYAFSLPAPPRPAGGAHLRVRVLDAGSSPTARRLPIRVHADGRGVHVSFTVVPGLAPAPARFVLAKRVLAGWTPVPARARPVHLRVRFVRLLVRRAMDPACSPDAPRCRYAAESTHLGQISALPGEWNLYWDVAGIWGMWKPSALLVHRDGQSFRGRQSVDVYLRRGAPWRLFLSARECDYGALGSEGGSTRPLAPCPRQREVGVRAGDDVPGNAIVHFRSPEAALGTRAVDSELEGSTCPRSNRRGCYRVTFRVTRVQDAAARAANVR